MAQDGYHTSHHDIEIRMQLMKKEDNSSSTWSLNVSTHTRREHNITQW